MDHIRSIEELSKARKEAFDQEMIHAQRHPIQIRVSMGSCGIAAGATETLAAIDQFVKQNGLADVRIKQIGCIGLCALEPIVQVVEFGGQPITYGKVDPMVVRRIFREHIERHLILQEHLVEIN